MKTRWLIGIDEAGRGPLAGPVSLAAIAWPLANATKLRRLFVGAKDSKQLSVKQREEWFAKIKQAEQRGWLKISAAFSGQRIIDERGIMPAIHRALNRALRRLVLAPANCKILLDGSLRAPRKYLNQKTITGGDEIIQIISLASIIAKVRRDRLMIRLAKKYPGYSFEIHKGYGTKRHYQALKKIGPSPLHRRSFL